MLCGVSLTNVATGFSNGYSSLILSYNLMGYRGLMDSLGEYEILHINLDRNSIPSWIEVNDDGKSVRVGLNPASFTLAEVVEIGRNVGSYYRGRALIKEFGKNLYMAIFLQKNPDYKEPPVEKISRQEALELFENIHG